MYIVYISIHMLGVCGAPRNPAPRNPAAFLSVADCVCDNLCPNKCRRVRTPPRSSCPFSDLWVYGSMDQMK